jgi:hypothetical protein
MDYVSLVKMHIARLMKRLMSRDEELDEAIEKS